MKKSLFIILIVIAISFFVKLAMAEDGDYNIYTRNQINGYNVGQKQDKILFIVDFSNSMNEKLGPKTKLSLAIDTIANILGKISPSTQVGLRVYGHRPGFTYVDGCSASKLMVPLGTNNNEQIMNSLNNTRAQGWTPITYSLKQAVNKDFAGVEGNKKIVLLTDGGENCDESPCTYAISLMQQRDDIKIDVIALDLYDLRANNQLKCTALTTRGKFYQANDEKALEDSLNDSINADIEVKGTVKVKQK